MTKLLPFSPKGTRFSAGVQTVATYYELQDDALSVEGSPPRKGDICLVRVGEEMEGEPHMLWTPSGQLICGLLHFDGRRVALEFPNPTFPPFTLDRALANIVGRVEQFFCAVGGNLKDGFNLETRRPVLHLIEPPALKETPRFAESVLMLITGGTAAEQKINWQADSNGRVFSISNNWRQAWAEPCDQTNSWGYIQKIHPDERRTVLANWLDALTNQHTFDVTCRVLTHTGYALFRNMAVPVRNKETDAVHWLGTLHLLSRAEATTHNGTCE